MLLVAVFWLFGCWFSLAAAVAVEESEADQATLADRHSLYYGVHLPEERVLSRGVTIATQLLEDARYAESLPVLIRVLHAPEDALPSYSAGDAQPGASAGGDSPSALRSLKALAAQIIKDLPEEGRQAYQLEVRAQSERELSKALRQGTHEIREVVARYPHTEACRLALWVLAQRAFEAREFAECVVCLDHLLECELPPRQRDQVLGQRTLAQLASLSAAELRTLSPEQRSDYEQMLKQAGSFANTADAVRAAFADFRASDRQEWLAAGGGPRRNPVLASETPHLWAGWVSSAASLKGWVAAASLSRDEAPQASAASPLVVGDWVVVRAREGLEGIHRHTGKLVWQCELPSHESESPSTHQLRRIQGDAASLKNALRSESRDAISSRTSSNGRLVFAVAAREPQSRRTTVNAWSNFRVGARSADRGLQNQIVAVDALSEGKLRWRTSDQTALDGFYFLDCPLVIGDRLFVLGEQEQSICLLQLDPRSGQLLWTQTIATVDSPVQEEAMRRMVGGCLSYAEGRIICSTGVGLVAAVDPLRRTLEWVYRFPVEGGVQLGRSTPWGRRGSDRWPRDAGRQWLWNQVLVTDGQVLVGSPESRRLHCIGLADGGERWAASNSWPQLLCAADAGIAVVARPDAVVGVSIADGKSLWTAPIPGGAHPAGKGAWFEGVYLLPLSTGDAMLIHPGNGEVAAVLHAGPDGVLGNIAFDGVSIFSQSFTGVSRFDVQQQPGSLLLQQAEIASVQGLHEQAVTRLLEGYQQSGAGALFAHRIRELVSRQLGLAGGDKASLEQLEQLYKGRPSPFLLRQARLDAAVAAKDRAVVLREVADYCRSPCMGDLVAVDAKRAVRQSAIYRLAARSVLSREERERLRRRLLVDAGPRRHEVVDAVLGDAAGSPASDAPQARPTDKRWAVAQVGYEVRPRVDRVRRRSRTGSNLGEFELPLLQNAESQPPPTDRFVMSTAGELLILNELGEIRSQLELSKSSPERLMRLAADGEPVAGRIGAHAYLSTGDDVLSVDLGDPESGAQWSAKRALQQVDVEGVADNAVGLTVVARAAAQREVRLVGVSPRGVTVAGRDMVACLDPESGRVVWMVTGVEVNETPSADERFVYSAAGEQQGWRLDLASGVRSGHTSPRGDRIAEARGRVATIESDGERAVFSVVELATGRSLLEVEIGPNPLHSRSGSLLSLLDASGELRVIDLQDAESGAARVVVRDKLPLDAEPLSLTAERISGRLLVGVNTTPAHVHRAAGVTPIDENPIQTGPLYCYDLATGEPSWPAPATISGKALLARQPPVSPLVLLAASVESRDATGRYDSFQLVAVDLYSGRTLRRERGPRDDKGRRYRIQLNEGPRPFCLIALDNSYLMLTAAAAPVAPGPPAAANAEQSIEGNLWNVGRAIGKLLGDVPKGEDAPEPEDDD
ncbi:outer membrane protein assembly factor BamB family protein [Posidoniimonas polymericola]|nr:PQQ-binding-like beta-propeller repeat protein [Posidoniimonas polymericola]